MSVRSKLTLVVASLIAFNVTVDALAYWISWQNKQGLTRIDLDQQVLSDALKLRKFAHDLHTRSSNDAGPADVAEVKKHFKNLKASITAEHAYREERGRDNKVEEQLIAELRIAVLAYAAAATMTAATGLGPTTGGIVAGKLEDGPVRPRAYLEQIDDLSHRLIEHETSELMETSQLEWKLAQLADLVIIIAIVVGLLSAILSIAVLIRAVRAPLETLTNGAMAFASGQLDHRIALHGQDEFAGLAATMNTMATELARRRAALEHESSLLQSAVDERTTELLTANQRLEETAALRRRFLAEIGHELRTPLTIIRGESEVALRNANSGPDEYRSALRRVLDQEEHTTALVNDLLFVAANEAGHAPLRDEKIDLSKKARSVAADVAVMAKERGIRIETGDDNGPIHVAGDSKKLRRLLLILLENAIAYSPRGTNVTVRVASLGQTVRLTIADKGHGMSELDQRRVFERYYRGAGAVHYNPAGTGLGLPMAKAIVEAHHGAIRLTSGLGHGTTIEVDLAALQSDPVQS